MKQMPKTVKNDRRMADGCSVVHRTITVIMTHDYKSMATY